MNFTKEQFDYLSKWEDNFKTATQSKWARHPGSTPLLTMHKMYAQVSGRAFRLNTSCQSCVLSFLQDVGKLYFADKEEMAQKKAAKKEKAETPKKPVKARKTKK